MSKVENAQSLPRGERLAALPPTPDYLAHLFLLSFRFSQGDNRDLQPNIFAYLSNLHPNWHPSQDTWDLVRQKAQEQIPLYYFKMIEKGKHSAKSDRDPHTEVDRELREFEIQLDNSPRFGVSRLLLSTIASEIIKRDFIFLPRKPQIVDHALEGKKTGAYEYDLMFKDLKSTIENPEGFRYKGDLLDNATHLIESYNGLDLENRARIDLFTPKA